MAVFLNSFYPLCVSKKGKEAVKKHDLPHFIDGSCRREPDFENPYPAITGLCRTDKLIKRLSEGDQVIYITNKGSYGLKYRHWRFVTILEVVKMTSSHQKAKEWYQEKGIQNISNNIICDLTEPFPSDFTHQETSCTCNGEADIKTWDKEYRKRAELYPEVAICKVWDKHLYLNDPPVITEENLIDIFNRKPGTQNPPKLRDREWPNFQIWLNE